MENIAIATLTTLPSKDASVAVSSGSASGTAAGLFGLMMASELGRAGAGKSGKKSTAETDPMMALMISALLQNAGMLNLTASQTDEAQADAGASSTAAISGAQGSGAAQTLLAWLSARQTGETTVSSQSAGEALTELLTAVGANTDNLQELLAGASKDGTDFSALLSALTTSNSDGSAGNGNVVSALASGINGNGQALGEIRQLFAELLEAQPDDQTGETTKTASADQGVVDAKPATRGMQELVRTIASMMDEAGDGEANGTASAGAKPDGTQSIAATVTTSKALSASPTRAAEPDTEVKKADGDATAAQTDFSAVVKSYFGNHDQAAAATGKAAKAEAATRAAEQAFDRIVDSIKSASTGSAKEMEISLKPDFLGKVVIKLSMDGGSLVAKIAASNPKVQDAFLSQAMALQNTLSEQGLKDVRVVVSSASVQDTALQQQSERRGQDRRDQQKKRNVVVGNVLPAGGNTLVQAYESYFNTGKINYLA